MKYWTTTEAGAAWGISPRRVAILASQGRIEGAALFGNSWLIPELSPKPADNRRKGSKTAPTDDGRYVFPFLLGCVHSQEQLEQFTPEEAELYRLCLCYEAGNFRQTREIGETLLGTKNPYIRIGALYHLTTTCLYLGDFAATEKYFILFQTAIHNAAAHKAELNLLLSELEFELKSGAEFAGGISSVDIRLLPDAVLPLFAAYKLSAELVMIGLDKCDVDISYHELNCRMVEAQGYFFEALYMHICLSAYYAYTNEEEKERMHMKRAVDIGLEHNTCFTLAYTMGYNAETAASVLSEYPPEVAQRFRDHFEVFSRARNAYAVYKGKATVLSRLTEEDYRLITYCVKQLRAEQIAEVFGLSQSGMNRRLSALYKKLGVKSRNEMVRVYKNSVMEWGRE